MRQQAPLNEQRDDDAFRYLVDLGYSDPAEVALRESARRSQLEAELQQALSAAQKSQCDTALEILNRLTRDAPQWIAPHELLAQLHFHAGRYADAASELYWLECHGCESPRLSLIAASLAMSRRDIREALELLDYVCCVEPELPAAHALHGEVLRRLEQFENAQNAFELAVELKSDDVRALDGLAAIALRRKDYATAAERALTAVEADLHLLSAHWHLGIALLGLNKPNDAMAAFEMCSKLDPNRVGPLRALIRLAEMREDHAAATAYRDRTRDELARRRELRDAKLKV